KITRADSTDVSIRFLREPSETLLSEIEDHGVRFYRMDDEILHVGTIYGAQIPWAALSLLEGNEAIERIESSWRPKVLSPLNVSGPEIQADQVWNLSAGVPALTGQGIRIAFFDTGVDVFHPTFWRADGQPVDWLDANDNGHFDNGIDGVDADADSVFDLGETLRFWDAQLVDRNNQFTPLPGVYEADIDWLYNDKNRNGTRDFGPEKGFGETDPTFGEPIYVIGDTNGNNALDKGEKLLPLSTCKIVATLERNGIERRGGGLLYDRGDRVNHGTSSCGIAVGGSALGRRLVGIAPGAALLSANRNDLAPEWYLPWARKLGADIMVYEFGTWIFEFLDGSSNLEQMIDELAREGIVQLTASGNLAGPARKKHCRTSVPAVSSQTIRINIPEGIGVRSIYLSVLWRKEVSDSASSADSLSPSLAFRAISPSGESLPLDGSGESTIGDIEVFSDIAVSSRETFKMDAAVFRKNGADGVWTLVVENGAGDDQRMDGYVTDDVTHWMNGAQFLDFVTDDGTVTWPATADESITVGAFESRGTRNPKGAINDYSGRGKRIDGKSLLDITAPGSIVYTAQSSTLGKFELGAYGPFDGTSSALPHVAGAAALLLQADPSLSHEGIRRALTDGALRDGFTGPVPNDIWGYGKLRIADALNRTGFSDNTPPLITDTTLLPDTDDQRTPYEVTACIQDGDGIHHVTLFFSSDSVHFEGLPMNPVAGTAGTPEDQPCFRAAVPAMAWGTRIWYYLEAEDLGGAVTTDPPGAPKRAFSFEVAQGDLLFEEVASVLEGNADGSDRCAVWGDYDGDGYPDLFVARDGKSDRLYHNNGKGSFSEVSEDLGLADTGRGRWAAWGDYDLDGDPDLYLVRDGQANLLYRNEQTHFVIASSGTEGFTWGRGRMAAWGDADGDGDPDLYVVNEGHANRLYRNLKDGSFEEVAAASGTDDQGRGTAAAWADYDLDGDLDLYVVNEGQENILYRNRGDGTFVNVASQMGMADSGSGRHALWGDFDGDGDPDLYVVNDRTDNLLYLNRPDSAFSETGWQMGVALAGPDRSASASDVDNDGDLDLYATEEGQPDVLYLGEDGGFVHTPFEASPHPDPSRQGAFADYDLDGGLDFFLLNTGAPNRLYRNRQSENHFIGIKLWENPGALIQVTAGGITQTRLAIAEDGLPMHFGLGENEQVDRIEITPPGGPARILRFLPVDQNLLIAKDPAVSVFAWPGDTDNDGAVGAEDLFPIETYWHKGGPPRIGATSAWIGQGMASWNPKNAGFADGNGDGIVDERDIATIALNWARIHPTRRGTPTVKVSCRDAYLALHKSMPNFGTEAMKTFVREQLEHLDVPPEISLANFPNPFDRKTTFRLALPPETERASLKIYDLAGQHIRTLLQETRPPGRLSIAWDGRDAKGRPVASGLYLCRLDIGVATSLRKVMVLR
ncbi:MAG: FG-GAP-like repeat-containing protein, partial [Candidatus Latescibacterota bacterium]